MVVDDHALFRDGLRALLNAQPDLRVVAEAPDARTALQVADATEYDVCLLDVRIPDSDGISLLRELHRRGHEEPAIMLTMHEERDFVLDALDAGAAGYALKRATADELGDAVRIVAAGGRWLAPAVRSVVDDDSPGILSALSTREREIFHLLATGGDNTAIGHALCISEKTVETHRTRIFRKLGVRSLAELVRLAARHHLLAS
jgi:DNA-binding NarL/FixJ family response regulator